MPQYSAHCPMYSPGVSGVSTSRLTRPGTTSRLPPSWGTQKEWMTSGPLRWKAIVCPTGMWASFAVTTLSAGDVNSEGRGGRGLLGLEDDADRRDADDEQDRGEGHRPRDLERRVPVDLLRDRRPGPVAEAPDGEEHRGLHEDEDPERPPGDQHEDAVGELPEVGLGDDGRHLRVPAAPAAGGCQRQDGEEQDRGLESERAPGALAHGVPYW